MSGDSIRPQNMAGYPTTDLREQSEAPSPGRDSNSDYMVKMRERFETARKGWEAVRRDFRDDLRYVCGDPTKQWDPQVKGNRDDDGIPALTMDRLNPLVNSIVNQARKDRPQPKVEAGDDGDPATAEAIEGKLRHVMYISHAEVSLEKAQAYCASGGIGYYKIVKEYTGKRSMNQEPRIKSIPDPMTEYPDPSVEEDDFSDAEYWFSRKKYKRAEYKAEFGLEPQPFEFPDDPYGNWSDNDEYVWVAEYWWVEKRPHEVLTLADGRTGLDDELGDFAEEDIVARRKAYERIIHCDIVDGEKRIEESIWEGEWIPRFVVHGAERIYQNERRFVSAVRYARDPQAFLNVSMSDVADRMATVNKAPFIGPKGAFKDVKWRDGKRHTYLEYEPRDAGGQPVPAGAVQRAQYEPNIQASTQAAMVAVDAIKGSVGYVDSVTRPSQGDISGVAVQRRDEQANLANMHYEDSLLQSMWHLGRAMVDLLMVLTDTPRVWQTRKEDGRQKAVPVTMDVEPGYQQFVDGHAPEDHIKIDQGDYGVVVYTGPSYATKTEEESNFLEQLFIRNPAAFGLYSDLYFKKRGYDDLAERAKMLLPPPVQQAMQAADGQINPQLAAQQAAQLQAQNQQLMALLQKVDQMLKTKQIEAEGKIAVQNAKTQGDLAVEKLKTIRALIEKGIDQAHDAAKHQLSEHTDAIEHLTNLLHESEMAPDPMEQVQQQPTGVTQ